VINDVDLRDWFHREVLPLEGPLTRYIRRNCARGDDIMDIRQDVYAAALKGAHASLPERASSYLFAIARNNLINRSRREKIVSFELVADMESVHGNVEQDDFDRQLQARDELRRALEGIRRLPARCAEVVRLRKVEGYSTRETAEHLGVTTHTVERQLTLGMRALTDFMLGGTGKVQRERYVLHRGERRQP
jgi:RNA polymerase sigma factor (sigma-70 family)